MNRFQEALRKLKIEQAETERLLNMGKETPPQAPQALPKAKKQPRGLRGTIKAIKNHHKQLKDY